MSREILLLVPRDFLELTLLRIVCGCNLKANLAQSRRARNVLAEIDLADNLLDLATPGGPHVDFARQVRLAAV